MSSDQTWTTTKSETVGQLWNDPDLGVLLTRFPFTVFLYGSNEEDAKEWVDKTFKGKIQIVNTLEEKVEDGPDPFVVSCQVLENYEVNEIDKIYDFVNKDEEFVWKKKDGTSTTIKKGRRRIILNFGQHQELNFEDLMKQLHSHLGWDEIGILNIPVYSTREVYNSV